MTKQNLRCSLFLICFFAFLTCAVSTSAGLPSEAVASVGLQTDEGATAPADTLAVKATAKPERTFGQTVWYYTKGIAILGFFAFAAVYIVITLIRKPRFVPVTADEMARKRREKGLPEASEGDNNEALRHTDRAFLTWKVISAKGEEERRSPTTMAQIKASHASLTAAIDKMPADPEAIERINELGEIINNLEKRRFTGSWKLIMCGLACCLFAYFMSNGFMGFVKSWWWLPSTIVLYYFASYSPEFLNLKRDRWFKGLNVHNVLIGTVVGLFASTSVTETWKTTYTDGSSKTSEEFNPAFFILFFLTIVVVLVLGFFTFIFAGLNFIRNYVIYA